MTRIPGFSCAAALVLAMAATAQNATELPSAPSATVAPKTQPAPKQSAPPAKPQDTNDLAPAPDPEVAPPKKEPPVAAAPKAEPSSPDSESDIPQDAPVFRTLADEVSVIFTVTDRRGRFIKDLKQADLRVLDNRLPIDRLRAFAAQTDLPLRVGLLIDASTSIRNEFKFEQQAAIEFLDQIVRPKADKAMVVSFDSVVNVEQDLTNRVDLLATAVRAIRPGGGTSLYDAVYSVCRDRLLKLQETTPVRRAMIVISDGDDNQSRVSRTEAVEMAQRAEVVIYTIGTNFGDYGKGDKVLKEFAEATGGRAFSPFKIEDVADAFKDIQDELRSQYAIAYKPANLTADGSFRSIEIQTPNKKYKVRARKGYFAPKGT